MMGSKTFSLSLVFSSSSQFLEQTVWGLYCNMSAWCLHSHRGCVMYLGVPGCVWGQCLVVQCQVSARGKGAFSVIFQRCSTNHTQGLSGKVFISKWRKTPENANCWAEWAAGGPIPRAALWFFQWSSLGRGMQHPQPQCTWCCQDTYEWVSLVRTAGAQWEQRKGILAEW